MSKGSSPRPHDPTKFREEYERIFKKQMAQRASQLQVERDAALYGTYLAREEEDTTHEEA